jgi:hypothetical protein
LRRQVAALLRCKSLSVLREAQLEALVDAAEPMRWARRPGWLVGPLERAGPADPPWRRHPPPPTHLALLHCVSSRAAPEGPAAHAWPSRLLSHPQTRYSPEEVIAPAGPAPCAAFFLVRSGEVLLVPPGAPGALPGAGGAAERAAAEAAAAAAAATGRLTVGELFNEAVLTSPAVPLGRALVAGPGGAVVITFDLAALNKALQGPGACWRGAACVFWGLSMGLGAAAAHGGRRCRPLPDTPPPFLAPRPPGAMLRPAPRASAPPPAASAAPPAGAAAAPTAIPGIGRRGPLVDFRDLELRRVVGTGQFGLVRLVRNVKTDEVFALKVRGGFWGGKKCLAARCDRGLEQASTVGPQARRRAERAPRLRPVINPTPYPTRNPHSPRSCTRRPWWSPSRLST